MKPISLSILLFACFISFSQTKPPLPYGATPSPRQLAWHELEMYVLIHFTPTTFENKEWGYGDAKPSVFNPTAFDAGQIVATARSAGFKGLVLVSKHHDGFALWPTKTTSYNISQSPWQNGKGDMVRAFSDACRAQGLRFGVYCSPWDRNSPHYGSQEYVKIYREQLRELYTQYGELFMSWHDGANGGDGYYGGTREKRQIDRTTYYGWDTTWAMTRKLQPNASLFSDIGWDVRWVGNERGEAAETSWATFTPLPAPGKLKPGPGESDYSINPTGTRNGNYWIPAECDVPLRKGWFFHPEENSTVKSAEKLFELYLKSVGRGGALDLGLAPDTRGLMHENDVKALKEFGELLQETFKDDLSLSATIKASNTRGKDQDKFGTDLLKDSNRYTYWATDDHIHTPELEFTWSQPKQIRFVRIREDIRLGQRIGSLAVDAWVNGSWQTVGKATSIGANRIIRLDNPVNTSSLRIRITESPVCPAISEVGIF